MQGAEQQNIDSQFQVSVTDPEKKYAFQVGIKDVDFTVNEQLIKTLGLLLPFRGVDQAEFALMNSAISITNFKEMDSSIHDVHVLAQAGISPIPYQLMGC